MGSHPTGRAYRLVGIGKCTKGLKHTLKPGEPVVIGRHPACTLVIQRTPEPAADFDFLSRQHAVIEEDPQKGWSIRDNGSSNGTSILHGGFPPAARLFPGVYEPLQDKDVIEFAECDHFNLLYQATATNEDVRDSEVEGHTHKLIAAERPCLQLIHKGAVRQVAELNESAILVGNPSGQSPGRARWLEIPSLETAGVLAEIVLEQKKAVLRSASSALLHNLRVTKPGDRIVLKDGDLLTISDVFETSILFLDPTEVAPRNLSDILEDASRITLGAAPDNDVRLFHPSVSRNHAVIWREAGTLFIRDLHSTNGTTVNGQRIFDSERLEPQSSFSIGRLPFVADRACWGSSGSKPTSVDVRFVRVSVEIASKLRLRQVSLAAGHGEMVGLLGPSASGKSTLLKTLSGQYRVVEGEIYVNGRPMTQNQSRWSWLTSLMGFRDEDYQVGFVQQHDLVQPELTVREVLEYAARQMGMDSFEASEQAENAGARCNLGPLMDRIAQNANGQLNMSGGQLKRICVALEVLRQPKILVLDEPTTGQDPKNTDDLMNLFRTLAQGGVTLLLSTHDLRNIEFFDKVAVLCLGYLVYYGPPGQFPAHFKADTPEAVYASLPDREALLEQAKALAEKFEATAQFRQYCQVVE